MTIALLCPRGRHTGPEQRPNAHLHFPHYPFPGLWPSFQRTFGPCGRGQEGLEVTGSEELSQSSPAQSELHDSERTSSLCPKTRVLNRLLSLTPLFFKSVHRVAKADDAGAAELHRTRGQPLGLASASFFSCPCLHRPTPPRARNTGAGLRRPACAALLFSRTGLEFAHGHHLRSRAAAPSHRQGRHPASASTSPSPRPCPFPPVTKSQDGTRRAP